MHTLAGLDSLNKVGSIKHRLRCAGIEPRETAPQLLYMQPFRIQIYLVNSGNFQLTSSRWLDFSRNFHDVVRVKIEAGHGKVGARIGRFLLDIEGTTVVVDFNHSEASRILNRL